MGSQTYLGFSGGLYPGGTNQAPPDHATAGASHAALVKPLDRNGNPSPIGKIVLVSIGMSNTTQEFCAQGNPAPCNPWTFMGQAAGDASVNHASLVIVNGAMGGQEASTWVSPTAANYDRVRDTDLAPAGVTEAQVQIAWVKVADAGPRVSLPSSGADAYTLEMEMGNIVRALKVRYPNLKLVYLSSRTYGGYATTGLNPEPYAYESGYAVKWLIQAQIDQMRNAGAVVDSRAGDLNHTTVAPWIAWGPYLWADGTNPRSDGLTWQPSDVRSDDGTHPSMSGQQKVGALLLSFFKNEPTARPWFSALSGSVCTGDATTLCLNTGRFKVQVNWRVLSDGTSGVGTAVPLTGDTGYFWFFSGNNVELLVKVVDGRVVNNKFWVFYGALSNVEYTITVTDTATGSVKTYFNPSGQLASVADTSAF